MSGAVMEEREQKGSESFGQEKGVPSPVGPGQRVVTSKRVVAGGADMLIETFEDGSVAVDGKKVTPYRSERSAT